MSIIPEYLDRYGEKDAATLARSVVGRWQNAVIVPSYDEDLRPLIQSLEVASQNSRTIVIVVVNARENSPDSVKRQNSATLDLWRNYAHDHLSILLVDRSISAPFPPGQGVGLARKLGSDIALHLFQKEQLTSPFLRTTDADAQVENTYLSSPKLSSETKGIGSRPAAGVIFPFSHYGTDLFPEETASQSLYERFLRNHADGLKRAGSPYAFPTIGSTLGFEAEAYALVRGFPRREAAEDFHFLNKLAQVGEIRFAETGRIGLHYRPSVRVPFGTGKAIATITQLRRRGDSYLVYDERSYDLLGAFLKCLTRLPEHRDVDQVKMDLIASCPDGRKVWELLSRLNTESALKTALATRPRAESLLHHVHTWFDALKTLRFIHLVRDELYPLVPLV